MIFAGQEYGTGSSRDWAAKGTRLMGVKAVVAQSFERIHRSNLVGMGVLAAAVQGRPNAQTLESRRHGNVRSDGTRNGDSQTASGRDFKHQPRRRTSEEATLTLRIDTPIEVEYYKARRNLAVCSAPAYKRVKF